MRTHILAALALFSTSCAFFQSDTFHCAGTVDGLTAGCLEFYDFEQSLGGQQLRASFAAFCSAANYAEAKPGECPVEGRIGGCRELHEMYTLDTYDYEGEVESIDEIRCTTGDTRIGPDGQPYEPGTETDDTDVPLDPGSEPICSDPSDSERTTIEVENATTAAVALYWGDFDCQEQRIVGLDPGQRSPVDTTVGHVFRVRAGRDVHNGAILAEFIVEADGSYSAREE